MTLEIETVSMRYLKVEDVRRLDLEDVCSIGFTGALADVVEEKFQLEGDSDWIVIGLDW